MRTKLDDAWLINNMNRNYPNLKTGTEYIIESDTLSLIGMCSLGFCNPVFYFEKSNKEKVMISPLFLIEKYPEFKG